MIMEGMRNLGGSVTSSKRPPKIAAKGILRIYLLLFSYLKWIMQRHFPTQQLFNLGSLMVLFQEHPPISAVSL